MKNCLYAGDEKNVELLLKNGVNVSAVDSFGKTALHWAAENGKWM